MLLGRVTCYALFFLKSTMWDGISLCVSADASVFFSDLF